MDELMLMEYLRDKGMGRHMSEHEFINRFKEFMSKDSKGHHMRHQNEGDYMMPDRMYDDFYLRRHNYSRELDDRFYPDRGQNRFFDGFNRVSRDMSDGDIYEMMRAMKGGSHTDGEHFNDSYAKYLVSNMYHFENGRKYVGEKFDIAKAKEICERYRGVIPQSITHADVYVAINMQYHDYCELFKSWFGEEVEQKIIESAMVFWFKDDDYKEGFKLGKYLKEH